ncbi:hypothetical protein JS578_09135 [Dysgonomonadaceae bacterium zrk40]|nr:hypothetical protein JS578_09135 [Dysgonomonadaceae bacterium zrk40]
MAAGIQPELIPYFCAKIHNYWHRFLHLNAFSHAMNVATLAGKLRESCKTFAFSPQFFDQNQLFTPILSEPGFNCKTEKNSLFPATSFFSQKKSFFIFVITFMEIMLLNMFSKKCAEKD